MHPPFRLVVPSAWLLVPALLVASVSQADAQAAEFRTDLRSGIGYSGVFPDAEIGASAFRMIGASGFGVFADVKTKASPLSRHNEYCPVELDGPCSYPEVWTYRGANDVHMTDHDEYRLYNLGAMWAPTDGFAFMLGGGFGTHWRVAEMFENIPDEEDQGDRLTDTGGYFVPHSTSPERIGQGVVGLLIRAGDRIAIRLGYETAPGGMSASGYLLLPW